MTVNGHVTDDVTSRDLKGQCRDPQNLSHYNCANYSVGLNRPYIENHGESYGHVTDDVMSQKVTL